jgi:hypothetical protein
MNLPKSYCRPCWEPTPWREGGAGTCRLKQNRPGGNRWIDGLVDVDAFAVKRVTIIGAGSMGSKSPVVKGRPNAEGLGQDSWNRREDEWKCRWFGCFGSGSPEIELDDSWPACQLRGRRRWTASRGRGNDSPSMPRRL